MTKELSPQRITQKLRAREVEPYIDPNREIFVPGKARPAAVLIPLLRNKNAWEILFIRRTSVEGDHHSGQVAFPGGRRENGDKSLEHTALRETEEEISLPAKQVRILGHLEDMVTISNYRVRPYVGVIPWPSPLHPSPSEVQRIFTIPLDWLSNPDNVDLRQNQIPGESAVNDVYYYEEYDGELLWGVSARITIHFLSALGLLK